MRYSKLFSAAFWLWAFVAISLAIPCPFDKTGSCDCTGDETSSKVFKDVICQFGLAGFSPFDGPNYTYTITGEVTIMQSNYYLSIGKAAFATFKTIGQLSLINEYSSLVQPIFHPQAFDGVHISNFSSTYLSGIIPAPEAIKNLEKNGFKKIHYQERSSNRASAKRASRFFKFNVVSDRKR